MSKVVSLNGVKKKVKEKTQLRISEFATLKIKEYLEEKIDKILELSIELAKTNGKKTIKDEHIEFAIKKQLKI